MGPLFAIAATLPLLLTEARATPSEKGVSVILNTGIPMAAGNVRATVGEHGLQITVANLALGEPSRVLGAGATPVFAQERSGGTVEFVVPIPAGRRCQQPVSVTSTPDGIQVSATCPMEPIPAAVESKHPASEATADQPSKSTAVLASSATTHPISEEPNLWRTIAPLAIVLVLTGGAALFLRKRVMPTRLIQVLETASLGPRRSLIIARVGQELLVLGASEAGVHLLRTTGVSPPEDASIVSAQETSAIGQTTTQMAASWLHRVRPPKAMPNFEAMLGETHDDIELRRKLASGFGGRVA